MVTTPQSRFRPPPDPPPSPCKSPPLEARSPFIPPEPPDPPDVLLLAPLQILKPSVSSPVPVVAATPRSFFATTRGLTGSFFVSFGVRVSTTWRRFHSSPTFQIEPWVLFAGTSLLFAKFSEGIFSVSSWNMSYVDEHYLGLGISCVKMNHLPLIEDVALSLNLLVPLVEDTTSSLTSTQYEDLTLPQYEDVTLFYLFLVPQYEAGIRTFVLLALVSTVAGIEAFKNGGFGWSIHGRDEAHDSQDSFPYMVSTFAVQNLALQEALLSASFAGLSKLQVISDTNVFFFALCSGMDLNGIACCLLDITNLATLFTPLSFKFYQCTAVCMAVAFAMYVFSRLCYSVTLF
ncbi:hypothetical protein Bca52824_015259 [Brassica carinata]|uniref:RNase H type-1 domain-containing protein n=1 Tax=Brassica carinata TaxID=52824 RepID=A0A8X7W2W8_BRACI|nr:hypothetical protein Bca52824_015259 [Brassica carinata]